MRHDERPTVLDNTETLSLTVADLYAELERERQRNAELEARVRRLTVSVEELKTFARDVSHDLKAPLAGIYGYAQLLEHLDLDFGRPPEFDEFVTEISRCTDRMRQLIDDVLHFTTLREARVHVLPVELNTLVDDMIVDAIGLTRPTPTITHDRLPAVQGDHGLVRRLLENLLGNAIKYVRPGEAARVHIVADTDDDGMVRISVCDRGVGIPDGQHEEIFKELHRAHPDAYPGSGLGLSICRRIVQRLGGDIGADPHFRDGARIWFRLPAARTSDDPASASFAVGRAG
jgi:signal transduction histidine kinase